MAGIRPAALSGTWYPDDAGSLAREVDGFLAEADPGRRPAGRPLIGLSPHAGYMYSGPTAGRLYGLLRDVTPERIVILAPNHRRPLRTAALSGAEAFATPLGPVTVDLGAVAALSRSPACVVDDLAHRDEHAIEIQLPLIQRTWPHATPAIVPVLVPTLSPDDRAAVAAALRGILDDRTLLLVSTDFTHYGAAFDFLPFVDDVPAELERLDSGAVLRILAGDPDRLIAYGRETGITMCGLEAAAVALACGLPAGHEGALVDYRRSGDRDLDYSHSVSYASVLICGDDDDNGGADRPRRAL